MSATFPEHFNLNKLTGSRAGHFDSSEDAFQQLVGDAFKAVCGHHSVVAPTAGRDGSIDVFVETGCCLPEPLSGLDLPAIVECKDHDDKLGKVNDNIIAGWKKVEKKLREKAEAGWKNLYEPWKRTHSYIYCVSAVIPNPKSRDDLQNAIKSFFDSLPTEQKPPIKTIRLLDWNDLRFWFNTLPHIMDVWVGVKLPKILDHKSYLEELSGFGLYLLDDKLKYIPPDDNMPWHPQSVLKRLEQTGSKSGVILSGIGGVGKTRTSLEISKLAFNQGWRVLHIKPGQPETTVEDLANEVLPNKVKTLLVFDYLDQMQQLDYRELRSRLIPEAAKCGIQLAMLANCRCGWMKTVNPERDGLFEQIQIQINEKQNMRIIESIIQTVAPKACEQLGSEKVFSLCGLRPTIALLIAKEIERRISQDSLKHIELKNLRNGDLTQWLQRRLIDDHLISDGEPSLIEHPSAVIVASAAALVCAPEAPENVVLTAQTVLETMKYDNPRKAKNLIGSLTELGWLELHGGWLYTAHDVVTDEVFERAIFDGTSEREFELNAALSSIFLIPRNLGRFAVAFRRLDSVLLKIQGFVSTWLRENAAQIGACCAKGDPDKTSYALGSVMSGPPWQDTAIELWDEIVDPWIKNNGTKEEARHLLYIGLQKTKSQKIYGAAVKWLEANYSQRRATFVLGPLIDNIEKDFCKTIEFEYVMKWLKKHGNCIEARFVLPSLLKRTDLEGRFQEIKTYAVKWLEKNGDSSEARFVVSRLLKLADLGADAEIVQNQAIRWLKKNGEYPEAEYVLSPLLNRTDLEENVKKDAVVYAKKWLEKYICNLEADFVLRVLLNRTDMDEHIQFVVKYAVIWLENNIDRIETGFLLTSLLNRTDLDYCSEQNVIKFTLAWLDKYILTTDAEFVIKDLSKKERLAPNEAERLVKAAVIRLKKSVQDEEATYLLRSCLKYYLNNKQMESELLGCAVVWLESNSNHPNVDFVFNEVLRRPGLSHADWKKVAKIAVSWLETQQSSSVSCDYTLNSLLRRPLQLDIENLSFIVDTALKWMESHAKEKEVAGLLSSVMLVKNRLPKNNSIYLRMEEFFKNHHVDPFVDLIKRLNAVARESVTVPDVELLREGCATVKSIAKKSPAAAAYGVPALLVLGARIGGKELETIKNVISLILADKRLTMLNKKGITKACMKSLNSNNFPDHAEAVKLLQEFGLYL